jgi:hypothetical protein
MLHACFTPTALCFVYTSWHFNAFSGTNLLTRCHRVSSLFSVFLCFRKVTQEIFLELDETKAEVPIYLTQRRSPEERRRWTKGQPRHQVVWSPGPPPDIALPPINSLRWENPKETNTFPRNILQAVIAVIPRPGGSRSSSRHPAGEGNHHRRPSSSPC